MHPVVMDLVVKSITDERLRAAEQHRRVSRAAVYGRRSRRGLLRRLTGLLPPLGRPRLPATDRPV
jgi:hypothetical protein